MGGAERKLPVSSPLRQAGGSERQRGEIQSLDIQDGNVALGGISGIRLELCQIFKQMESIFAALWGDETSVIIMSAGGRRYGISIQR